MTVVFEPWRTVLLEIIEKAVPLLVVYEQLHCFCFHGHPGYPYELKPVHKKGECTANVTGLARAILGAARYYARGKITLEEFDAWKDGKLTYTHVPNFCKTVQAMGNVLPYGCGSLERALQDMDPELRELKLKLKNQKRGVRYYVGPECRDPRWWGCDTCSLELATGFPVFHPPTVEMCP